MISKLHHHNNYLLFFSCAIKIICFFNALVCFLLHNRISTCQCNRGKQHDKQILVGFVLLDLQFDVYVLYFFFWPLCCLFFFDIQILITPLESSSPSYTMDIRCGFFPIKSVFLIVFRSRNRFVSHKWTCPSKAVTKILQKGTI